MKKRMINYVAMAAATFLLAIVSGCIDNLQPQIDPAVQSDTYFFSVIAKKADALTKALTLNENNTITATWEDGETVDVYFDGDIVGTLTASTASFEDKSKATLSGTISNTVKAGYSLTLQYKAPDYNNQDGTLETIAANCDYATATVSVSSVDETTHTATPSTSSVSFTNQQAIVKFTLKTGDSFVNPKKITINYGQNVISFPISSFSVDNNYKEQPFYAAIPGDAAKTMTIIAETCNQYGPSGVYYFSKTNVTLNSGSYYRRIVNMVYGSEYLPLTFEAFEEGETKVKFTAGTDISFGSSVEYRKNSGDWKTYTSGVDIELSKGDVVSFRGSLLKYRKGTAEVTIGSNFSCDRDCYVYGNITSLLNPSTFATVDTKLDPSTQDCVFSQLFKGNTHIKSYPGSSTTNEYYTLHMPITVLSEYCFSEMFSGCTGLVVPPVLLAMEMKTGCYQSMFYGCSSLTELRKNPASELAPMCYQEMFSGCSSLSGIPNLASSGSVELAVNCYAKMFENCTNLYVSSSFTLPAMTLANNCYWGMFMGCTHISYISSDILPATTLADNCYKEMFKGCTGLTSASKLNLPAGNTEGSLAESCYESMFEGCTNLRDSQVPELPAMTLAKNCYKSMFAGCHIYTTPTLPATTLVFGCYDNMFKGCTNLNKVICMATNVNNSDTYTSDWLMNVSSNGTFIKPDNMTGGGGGWQIGISGIPKEWFYAKFSVSGTQTVYFSKANLMAKFSKAGWMYDAVDGKNNCTWSFCNYTKMFVGTVSDGANTKINGFGTVSAGGDIDLFGWSKTGTGYYNNYYGICNTTTNDNYTGDLYDWGKTNVSGLTQWKTLTQAEWDYLLGLSGSGRTASTVNSVANARFAIIEVHQTNNYSTYGLMIFPDYYTHPNGNPVINNINSTSVVKNNISSFTYDEWYAMQCVGAVFLPMAGQRTGTTVSNCSETSSTVIGIGQYWSSTPNGDDEGYALVFGSGSNNTSSISIQSVNRYVGGCVRLVRKTD